MKVIPSFQYTGCSLELTPEEAQKLSMICLSYNRSVPRKFRDTDPYLQLSVQVMQSLDRAKYLPDEPDEED